MKRTSTVERLEVIASDIGSPEALSKKSLRRAAEVLSLTITVHREGMPHVSWRHDEQTCETLKTSITPKSAVISNISRISSTGSKLIGTRELRAKDSA